MIVCAHGQRINKSTLTVFVRLSFKKKKTNKKQPKIIYIFPLPLDKAFPKNKIILLQI